VAETNKTQHARLSWGTDDYFSFLDLPEGIGEGGSALSPRYPTIEAALDARRKHPLGAWLFQNADFQKAWALFRRLRSKATDGPLTKSSAELIFLRLVVLDAGLALLRLGAAARQNRTDTKKGRDRALRHVKTLLSLFGKGLGMQDTGSQRQLASKLHELQIELSKPRSRRVYSAERTKGSAALKTLAQSLQSEFQLRSPAIIEHVSKMIGSPRDTRACARYCDAAEEPRLELLVTLD
jgi:hypothetical protein